MSLIATFTLAMLLNEVEELRSFRISILGTDLCASNIEQAQRAIYRPASFRVTDDLRKKTYFENAEGGLRPKAEIRRMCHFNQANLLSPSQVKKVGRIDIIFCRNVMIY